MAEAAKTIEIEVLRYRPEQEDAPVVADATRCRSPTTCRCCRALQYIKDELDGTLSFRWSCRMAICGSCGMMINGKPELSCQTFLRDLLPGPVRVEALAHFPIERDLVVERRGFRRASSRASSPTSSRRSRARSTQGEYLQTPQQLEQFEQFSSCINCMLCYAACPQFGLDPEFTGPGRARAAAPLQRRFARRRPRRSAWSSLNAEEGVWSCTAVGYCSEVCPKHVDPANAVNQNKVNSAKDYFLRFLSPQGRQHERQGRRRQALRAADARLVAARSVLRALHDARGHRAWSSRPTRSCCWSAWCASRQGEAAWNGWLAGAAARRGRSLLHVVLLVAMVYHA